MNSRNSEAQSRQPCATSLSTQVTPDLRTTLEADLGLQVYGGDDEPSEGTWL